MPSNPILKGFNPDPSIVRVGDDYYIATSTFEWYPGVQIHHSRDLINWTLMARPLNRAALLDMRGNPDSCGVWAPCLSYSDGLFHLIYSNVRRFEGDYKDVDNFLTTCETIDGEWSDPVYLNSSGFDPSMFHDDDGKKWLLNMVWDHRPGKNRFAGILLQEYDAQQKRLIGTPQNIFLGTEAGLTEAPHLYRRNGYYYLLTAEGGTGYEHRMTFARAKEITGPYEVDPNGYFVTAVDHPELPLQRCGHGDIVETPSGEVFAVFLCGRPLPEIRRCPLGRETALQRAEWGSDGWLRLSHGGSYAEEEFAEPDLEMGEQSAEATTTFDEFNSAQLPMHYQWLRTPFPESFMSLEERPGYLRLRGKRSIGNHFEQALIARRQEHWCFSASTSVEFAPENYQQMAGLVCYYNAHKFHYLYISHSEEHGRHLAIMSCLGDPSEALHFPLSGTEEEVISIPEGTPIHLRSDVNEAELTFYWSADGENWQAVGASLDHSIVSDEAGKGEGASFTGAFVGMCCQDISGTSKPADFAYFKYQAR
ncbi:glycoside hydrolase 43 family protein [Microbulbifer agarilyticus]|uniref:Glycoside hydrolase 43 family protein n=1 Tax=Microbulbifer agarilyticus TaxID=260552 RepID=A0A1Q2M290_9GAMM|nr:glycoside hydrolase family 43 protein [Microbulbifer agarilyticus]AQQ66824.1 glycoside hydrolase 43 family protein [Microbulbifer agarilyticus]